MGRELWPTSACTPAAPWPTGWGSATRSSAMCWRGMGICPHDWTKVVARMALVLASGDLPRCQHSGSPPAGRTPRTSRLEERVRAWARGRRLAGARLSPSAMPWLWIEAPPGRSRKWPGSLRPGALSWLAERGPKDATTCLPPGIMVVADCPVTSRHCGKGAVAGRRRKGVGHETGYGRGSRPSPNCKWCRGSRCARCIWTNGKERHTTSSGTDYECRNGRGGAVPHE